MAKTNAPTNADAQRAAAAYRADPNESTARALLETVWARTHEGLGVDAVTMRTFERAFAVLD